MWQSVLQAVREGLSGELQHHQAMGLLLALYRGRIRRTAAQRTARRHNRPGQANYYAVAWRCVGSSESGYDAVSGESTLRRRLQLESRSFRQIVEEVVWPTRWGNYSRRRDLLATLRKAAATCQARALAPFSPALWIIT